MTVELGVFDCCAFENVESNCLIQNMGVERANPTPEIVIPGECVHRWRIEEPNGPTSTGVCKRCGDARQFKNWTVGNFESRAERLRGTVY